MPSHPDRVRKNYCEHEWESDLKNIYCALCLAPFPAEPKMKYICPKCRAEFDIPKETKCPNGCNVYLIQITYKSEPQHQPHSLELTKE